MAQIRVDCISIQDLRELIDYDPESGKLTWKKREARFFVDGRHSAEHAAARWNKRYAGTPALASIERAGYGHGDILGKRYKAHRVAWAIHYGEWPAIDIGHDDQNPSNNKIRNLGPVTKSENMKNQKLSSSNSSGHIGVSWASHRRKWSAQIKVRGRKHHLGLFNRFEDAVSARKSAETDFNFHPLHGRKTA